MRTDDMRILDRIERTWLEPDEPEEGWYDWMEDYDEYDDDVDRWFLEEREKETESDGVE